METTSSVEVTTVNNEAVAAVSTADRSLRERAHEARMEGRERTRQERRETWQRIRNRAEGIINGLVGAAHEARTAVADRVVGAARDVNEAAQRAGRRIAEAGGSVKDLPGKIDSALDVPVTYATNREIRQGVNREVADRVAETGRSIRDRIEGAASRFSENMGNIWQETRREWHEERRRMGRVVEDIADDVTGRVRDLAERSGRAAARFGVGRVRDVALGVIGVWEYADRHISNARASVDSMAARPLMDAGERVGRRLQFPHEVVKGVVEGWESRRSTEAMGSRLGPIADFLGNCRQTAEDAWVRGSNLSIAANEIRSGLVSRDRRRDQIRQEVRRGADQARAELR